MQIQAVMGQNIIVWNMKNMAHFPPKMLTAQGPGLFVLAYFWGTGLAHL